MRNHTLDLIPATKLSFNYFLFLSVFSLLSLRILSFTILNPLNVYSCVFFIIFFRGEGGATGDWNQGQCCHWTAPLKSLVSSFIPYLWAGRCTPWFLTAANTHTYIALRLISIISITTKSSTGIWSLQYCLTTLSEEIHHWLAATSIALGFRATGQPP